MYCLYRGGFHKGCAICESPNVLDLTTSIKEVICKLHTVSGNFTEDVAIAQDGLRTQTVGNTAGCDFRSWVKRVIFL